MVGVASSSATWCGSKWCLNSTRSQVAAETDSRSDSVYSGAGPEMIVSRKSNSGRNRSSAVNSMSVPLRCPNPPTLRNWIGNRLRAAGHLAEDHVRRMFSLVNFRAGELRGEKLDGEVRLGGHHPRPVEADAFHNFSQAIIGGQLGFLLVPGKQTLNRHHKGPRQP